MREFIDIIQEALTEDREFKIQWKVKSIPGGTTGWTTTAANARDARRQFNFWAKATYGNIDTPRNRLDIGQGR